MSKETNDSVTFLGLARQLNYVVHWSPSIHKHSIRNYSLHHENLFHSKLKPFLIFFWTQWVQLTNLSIIFDLFDVLYTQTMGDYHKLCSRDVEENFFHLRLSDSFLDQANREGKRRNKRCIKWIYFIILVSRKSVFESHVV